MEERVKLKIQQYEDALRNFEQSLSIDLDQYPELVVDSLKSGRVQKFEVCVEIESEYCFASPCFASKPTAIEGKPDRAIDV